MTGNSLSVWFLVALSSVTTTAASQESSRVAEKPFDAARALDLCTSEGALGYRFGEQRAAGGRIGLTNSQFVSLAPEFAPFEEAELVFTGRSQVLHSVVGIATFVSPEAAEAAVDEIEAAAARDPRFVRSSYRGFVETLVLSTDETEDRGLRIEVGTLGRNLDLTCIDAALRERTFDELAGRDPLSRERPTEPELDLPPAPAAEVCEMTEPRAALLRELERSMESMLAYGQESQRYGEHLATYKAVQMVERGIWAEDERADFEVRAALDPSFIRSMTEGINEVGEFVDALVAVDAAREQGNDRRACDAAVTALTLARGLSERNKAQWRAIAARYDDEARRRGAKPVE